MKSRKQPRKRELWNECSMRLEPPRPFHVPIAAECIKHIKVLRETKAINTKVHPLSS